MTTLSPDSNNPAMEASVRRILDDVDEAHLDAPNAYKVEGGRQRYFWPEKGRIVVTVTELPQDSEIIKAAIKAHLERAGSDNRIRFPVKEIEIDREAGEITIIGDPKRISEMRPLPRH